MAVAAGVSQSRREPGISPAPFTPLLNRYLVELRAAPATTAGGIWLPDSARENWTDGVVLSAGPGIPMAFWEKRTVMWAAVGEVVLFPRFAFEPFGTPPTRGLVADDQLVAVLEPGGEPEPLNDWVKILQDPPEQTEGALALAEEYRPQPMRGTVAAHGPGKLRKSGPLFGTRRPLGQGAGVPEGETLVGKTVYWTAECEALALGRRHLEYVFVQADDLWAMEE